MKRFISPYDISNNPANTRRRFDIEIWLNFGHDIDNHVSTSFQHRFPDTKSTSKANVVSTLEKYAVISTMWLNEK